jgi:hypothetical protein
MNIQKDLRVNICYILSDFSLCREPGLQIWASKNILESKEDTVTLIKHGKP